VSPCRLVERLHISLQSHIFCFEFIILSNGEIGIFSLHKGFFFCSCFCCSYYSLGCRYCWLPYLPGNCHQKKMSVQGLTKDVLEQLECPVCMQYMLPPITLCSNGHNICSSCKQKIQKCPSCREPLSDTLRNRAMEKLAVRVECPCSNKPHGCTLTFYIALVREHEDVGQFGPFDCPLNYRIKCNWTGSLTEIKDRVLHKNKDILRRPYVRRLGLTRPTVGDYYKDKIYVDISLSSDNLFFFFLKRMRLYEMHFTTSYSTLGRRKELHNSNINLCLKVSQKK